LQKYEELIVITFKFLSMCKFYTEIGTQRDLRF